MKINITDVPEDFEPKRKMSYIPFATMYDYEDISDLSDADLAVIMRTMYAQFFKHEIDQTAIDNMSQAGRLILKGLRNESKAKCESYIVNAYSRSGDNGGGRPKKEKT